MLAYVLIFQTTQWLEGNFLSYLNEWEKSVGDRDGYDDEEKEKMMIAEETRTGLRLTGKKSACMCYVYKM